MQKTKETKRFFSVTVTETSVKVSISETMNAEQLLWSESLESTAETLLLKEECNILIRRRDKIYNTNLGKNGTITQL